MPHGLPQVPPELLRTARANAPSTPHSAPPRRWWFERYLVDDWRLAWRFSSVRLAAALALLTLLQTQVLPLWQFAVPPHVWQWIAAGMPTLIVLMRVLRQASLDRERAQAAQARTAPAGVTPTGAAPSAGARSGAAPSGAPQSGATDPTHPDGGPQ